MNAEVGTRNSEGWSHAWESPVRARIAQAQRLYRWAMTRLDRVLPDWFILIRKWRKMHGRLPRIVHPVTFNEKILHRILFDRRQILTRCADKAAVRLLVEERLGAAVLPQLHGLTADPHTILVSELPDQFVVKPTHGSGWVEIVRDKQSLDFKALARRCEAQLKDSYYRQTREWAYRDVPPQILIEEFIDDGGETPNDYKLFVFNGTVHLIHVDVNRFGDHRRNLYTPDWQEVGRHIETARKISGALPPPPHLAEMIAAAQTLAADMEFARVDFYDTADRFYFGEITMTPGCGLNVHLPPDLDLRLGRLWKKQS